MKKTFPTLHILALVALLLAPALAMSQDVETTSPIKEGQTLSGHLTGSETQSYALDLAEEQFVQGFANQIDVDVVITIMKPDGIQAGNFDLSALGHDYFQFDSKAAGTYHIQIKSYAESAGDYELHISSVDRIATEPKRRVDQLMSRYDRQGVPGGVVAVVEKGKITFAKAYGEANLSHNIPFRKDTITNIGSTSKQFTAFAVLLLAKEGKLSLDDDIRTHIEELPDFGETVTIRNLLTHTSGYREFLNTLAMAGRRLDEGDYIDRKEILALVQNQPELQNSPGAEWNYNNTAFVLLTIVVERLSGLSFPEFLAEHVFGPLGMTDTRVRGHRLEVIPNSAQGYGPAEGAYREVVDLGGAMGAGGIYTTITDLSKWLRNFHTGDVGGKDILEQMTTPFVLTNGDTTQYGFGLFIDEQDGLNRIHHGGADAAHRSMLMYFPEIDSGIITLSNNAGFVSPARTMAELFFGEHMEESPESTEDTDSDSDAESAPFDPLAYNPEDFDVFAGRYELVEMAGFVLTFSRDEDTFYTQATGQDKVEMVPTSDSTFALSVVEASLTFHVEPDGSVNELTLHQNGEHKATRIQEEPWSPTVEDLEQFTATYFCAELQTFYGVAIEEEKLLLKHRRMDDIALTPTKEDSFGASFPIATLDFTRDEDGRITGFLASNGRTRDVRFERQD